MTRIFSRSVLGAIIGCGALLASGTQAAVITDSFASTGPLVGKAPTTPQTSGDVWGYTSTLTHFTVNTAGTLTVDGSGARMATLPFTPATGNVYRLSADVQTLSGNWLALGYKTTGSASDGAPSSSGQGAAPWALLTPSGGVQAFGGAGTGSQFLNGYIAPGGGSIFHNIALELDTTGAQWKTTILVDGVVASAGAFTGTHTYATNPAITGIFIGNGAVHTVTQVNSAGSVKNLQLVVVPEPATLGLVGVAAAGALRRRRRRRTQKEG